MNKFFKRDLNEGRDMECTSHQDIYWRQQEVLNTWDDEVQTDPLMLRSLSIPVYNSIHKLY